MSMQNLWWMGVVVASLVAAPLGVVRADEALPRTVSVTGEGEVSAQPDMARVTLGVESRKPTMDQARADVAATVDKVLALTRELRIDPKLVNATRVQVQPEYSWNDKDRKRVLLGYIVSRQVEVELRDLEQLGPLMERAVTAGVNQVGDPQLDSSRRKDLQRQAMTRAVQDARLNAETLVGAAGARLGPVRTLNASATPPMPPVYKARAAAADAMQAGAEQSYQAGEMKFLATVSAEYDLLPGS